ncbi:unnamed protein product [Gadus morhua 'NCC']
MHNLLAEEPINDFLTAQLVCEDRPSGQRYNVLTDVFALRRDPNDPASTQFYGLFTSSPPSGSGRSWRPCASSVCPTSTK